MPPKPLMDLAAIDPNRAVADLDAIRKRNPQRFEMEMLDRIVHFDPDAGLIAGIKEVREDGFWARGHFPGRPVLPGVLMIEAVGQLCGYYFSEVNGSNAVLGFAAADGCKFRGLVQPDDDLLLIGHMQDLRSRRATFASQGWVGDRMVFEGTIVGMAI